MWKYPFLKLLKENERDLTQCYDKIPNTNGKLQKSEVIT